MHRHRKHLIVKTWETAKVRDIRGSPTICCRQSIGLQCLFKQKMSSCHGGQRQLKHYSIWNSMRARLDKIRSAGLMSYPCVCLQNFKICNHQISRVGSSSAETDVLFSILVKLLWNPRAYVYKSRCTMSIFKWRAVKEVSRTAALSCQCLQGRCCG